MPLQTEQTRLVTGNASALRVAEFRSRHARLDVPVSLPIGQTVDDLALYFGCSKAVVVRSMLRFALTNRDWQKQGLIWGD